MDIAHTTRLTAAASNAAEAQPGSVAGAASLMVLRKAMDGQASNAAALLGALPQPPALAAEGSLGRNVNTFA
ncbi:MAG: putative motility protein [Roseateles sp.]|uniref:putative motility protein n=1 Tax=Roseateles sp. TaxID=1971397 RepID=UPI0039ECB1C2